MATMPVGDPTLCSNCSHGRGTHIIDKLNDLDSGSACTACISCPGYGLTEPAAGYEAVRVMRLEPGDVIVVSPGDPVTDMEYKQLAARYRQVFPDHKIVLLDAGWDIRVVRPGEGGESAT